jgi:N-acetylated-alpha-linked acidic dipeptidase
MTLKEVEQFMLVAPSNDSLREYLDHYTSEAHLAGTESDRAQAEWTRDKFEEFGIPDVKIETYWPLLNYPKNHRVAIVSGPKNLHYEAKLREDVAKEDKTSKGQDDVPTFHGKDLLINYPQL